MITVLFSALNAKSVSAVLLAVGVGVAYTHRVWVDHEAIEDAARQPARQGREARGFRFPAPDAYPFADMPWIKSREDLIAHYTRGEDPGLVRRYIEGPEEELIEYLGEVFARSGYPSPWAPPAGESDPEDELVIRNTKRSVTDYRQASPHHPSLAPAPALRAGEDVSPLNRRPTGVKP